MTKPLIKIEGPPGTGKSRTLVREAVRRVLAGEVSAEKVQILATSSGHVKRLEASLEMACSGTALSSQLLRIETFEQFCLNLLQGFSPEFSPETQLLSEQEAHILLRRMGQQVAEEMLSRDHLLYFALQTSGFARNLYPFIRQFQTLGLSSDVLDSLNNTGKSFENEQTGFSLSRFSLFLACQRRFLDHCQTHHLMTYRDLTEQTETLLREHPTIRQRIQQAHSLLLVDEAQELSQRRFQLLAHLYPETDLIFAGNHRLSVTEFRGAAPHWFADLARAFGPETLVTSHFSPEELTCYRNNEAILWWVSEWLEQRGYGKSLWALPPVKGSDDDYRTRLSAQVHMGSFKDPEQEAQAIAQKLKDLKQKAGQAIRWQDMAILLRHTGGGDGLSLDFESVLIQVLSDHQIPVCCNGFPESLQWAKTMLFHALSMFEQLEKLGVESLLTPHQQEPWAEGVSLSGIEQSACVEALNRHLVMWLSFDPTFSEATDLLNEILRQNVYIKEGPLSFATGWDVLVEYSQSDHPIQPEVKIFLEAIERGYQGYRETQALFPLAQLVIEQARMIHSFQRNPSALRGLGDFLHTLKSLDSKPGIADGLNGFSQEYPFMWSLEAGDSEEDAVQIKSIQQVQGHEFDVVFIPNLVTGVFPQTAQDNQFFTLETSKRLREFIQSKGQNPYILPLGFDQAQHDEALRHEAALMALALSRVKEQLFITTHQEQYSSSGGGQEPVQPSVFFNDLLSHHPVIEALEKPLAEIKTAGWLTDLDLEPLDLKSQSNLSQSSSSQPKTESRLFYGSCAWSQLPEQEAEALYTSDDVLSLSSSGIGNYTQCPRRFFYNQVLNIRTESGQRALEGTLVHKLLETLNEQFPEQPYTGARLKALTEALFNEDTSLFDELDFQKLRGYSPIARLDLKQWVLSSIEDLEAKGYFDRTPREIKAEHPFRFQVEHLDRVEFNGKIDALIQYEEPSGETYWELIDYKTSRSDFKDKKPEKRLDALMAVFQPLGEPMETSSEERSVLTHDEVFGNETIKRNYQVPIYYKALQKDLTLESLGSSLRGCGLQMVRPEGQSNGQTGSIQIMAEADALEKQTDALFKDLSQWVITPLLESTSLPVNPGKACDFCPFTDLCDASGPIEPQIESGEELF